MLFVVLDGLVQFPFAQVLEAIMGIIELRMDGTGFTFIAEA